MVFIVDNLYIGNYREALNPSPGIEALLCVAEEIELYDQKCLYHKIPVIDMRPIPGEQLAEAVIWIRENISDYRIMVFCHAGIGRSPSVAVAYLCCLMGFSFGEAVDYITERKPDISILPRLLGSIEETRKQIKNI